MLATAVIAFREFLEAFLVVGIFLGVSRKLGLRREFEILLAAGLGVLASLAGAAAVFVFGDNARAVFSDENAAILESYLLVFSGVFIAYVVFSLHGMMNQDRTARLDAVKKNLAEGAFDISLFLTIAFLVIREGFEIVLFTASVSLFSEFMQNLIGLFAGFTLAATLGLGAFLVSARLPIAKIFKATEYAIIVLGAALTQNGLTKLFAMHFGLNLSDIVPLGLSFLPGPDSAVGHLLQGLLGLDQELSLARLSIMLAYIATIYFLFLKKPAAPAVKSAA